MTRASELTDEQLADARGRCRTALTDHGGAIEGVVCKCDSCKLARYGIALLYEHAAQAERARELEEENALLRDYFVKARRYRDRETTKRLSDLIAAQNAVEAHDARARAKGD